MSKNFSAAQNSLEVLKIIVNNHPVISSVKIISHEVGNNWRQIHLGHHEKIRNLGGGFEHDKPKQEKNYSRKDFLDLTLEQLQKSKSKEVWSFVSKVQCDDGISRHIPMMNFHPEEVGLKAIKEAINHICGAKRGCILDSGRFFHYYGNFLLDENEWRKFMAEFLMPCILVSPRYVGHRLYDGYCTLRLTAQKQFKPKLPEVIDIL